MDPPLNSKIFLFQPQINIMFKEKHKSIPTKEQHKNVLSALLLNTVPEVQVMQLQHKRKILEMWKLKKR